MRGIRKMTNTKSMAVCQWSEYVDKLRSIIHYLEYYQLSDECTEYDNEIIEQLIKEYEKEVREIKLNVENTIVSISGLRV